MKGMGKKAFSILIKGHKPGPIVMVTAGIHGTEIAGIYAAKKMLSLRVQRGRLLIIPIVNAKAYLLRTRGIPDVNRQFPRFRGDHCKTPLAQRVFELAKTHRPTWCIDLHEATGFASKDPAALGQSIRVYPNAKTQSVVQTVVSRMNIDISTHDHHFVTRSCVLPGSFRTACAVVLGAHSVTTETSMQLSLQRRIQYQFLMVENIIKELKMI